MDFIRGKVTICLYSHPGIHDDLPDRHEIGLISTALIILLVG